MRYWWVNQNQTFTHEVNGGYLWSPKRSRDGSINHFYETMREVAHGDLVFSFNNKKIMALGIAVRPAYTCPKPAAFGTAGMNWNDVGWRVDVAFKVLRNQIQPKDHIDLLRPFLTPKYSPIRPDGVGNQIYLAEITGAMAEALMALIGYEASEILKRRDQIGISPEDYLVPEIDILQSWEDEQVSKVQSDERLKETVKEQIIKSRRGQGLFRNRVSLVEARCRITLVDQPEHLIASHIKPWRVAANEERLDGENGLFLTPTVDHLFGNGYISFSNSGSIIVSSVAHKSSLTKMGVPDDAHFSAGKFTRKQETYLEYHRDCILLKACG